MDAFKITVNGSAVCAVRDSKRLPSNFRKMFIKGNQFQFTTKASIAYLPPVRVRAPTLKCLWDFDDYQKER